VWRFFSTKWPIVEWALAFPASSAGSGLPRMPTNLPADKYRPYGLSRDREETRIPRLVLASPIQPESQSGCGLRVRVESHALRKKNALAFESSRPKDRLNQFRESRSRCSGYSIVKLLYALAIERGSRTK